MPIPWLRLLDILLGVTNLAQSRAVRATERAEDADASGHHETRLTGLVAAALREVFERDARRSQLLREKFEADRQRAERALRVELLGRAADREASRLRWLAGCALVSWIGTVIAIVWLNSDELATRLLFGTGMLLQLASLASAFLAAAATGDPLELLASADDMSRRSATAAVRNVALWLLIAGLASVGLAVVL